MTPGMDDADTDDDAVEPAPTNAFTGLVAAAWAAYKAGRPQDGIVKARAALALDAHHGQAWEALAVCCERAGRLAEADHHFRTASHCERDAVAPPYRIAWARFEALVARAKEDVPATLQPALAEVAFVLSDYAEPELLADEPDDEVLGLFVGHARDDRLTHGAMPEVPTIHLFRRSHEHQCTTRDEFTRELRRTFYHEFGHYLGFGEEGLAGLGLD